MKNFLALTLLSTGTPMLLMGDEVRRTQHGNNNAYCIDDETTSSAETVLDETVTLQPRSIVMLVTKTSDLATMP